VRAGDRQILQRDSVDLVLRRLHHDRIGHAVVGIEPEGRRDLEAAGQVDDQAVGHVALGQATYCARVRSTSTLKVGLFGDCWMRASAMPGMRRSCAAAGWHRRNWRRDRRRDLQSIGAGAPKFRIWLMMSAGRNAKVVPGNCARQLLAQRRRSPRSAVVLLELDLDVAVLRADHAGVVVGMLMPLIGMPMLSTMRLSSPAG
jgi:hypothetical protein